MKDTTRHPTTPEDFLHILDDKWDAHFAELEAEVKRLDAKKREEEGATS